MQIKETVEFGGKMLSIETGCMAKQADGAVVVRYGDTMVLVTAVANHNPRDGVDFLPLTVEYTEKTAAAGKIPGGYFKREGRPTESEILTCRLIDRPSRPLFPKGWRSEIQVIGTVISYDKENPTDVLAMVGASCALHTSDIPWAGPFAAVRVGRIDHQFIVNPTFAEREKSELDMVVACTRDAIVMVEGGAAQLSEEIMIDALLFAHQTCQSILDLIEKIRAAAGKAKRAFTPPVKDEQIAARVKEIGESRIRDTIRISGKHERRDTYAAVVADIVTQLGPGFPDKDGKPRDKEVRGACDDLHK